MKNFKRILILLCLTLIMSFTINSFPCHPNGDIGPCMHRIHILGDKGVCCHTCVDAFGNVYLCHPNGDLYQCVHRVHDVDISPCIHICY